MIHTMVITDEYKGGPPGFKYILDNAMEKGTNFFDARNSNSLSIEIYIQETKSDCGQLLVRASAIVKYDTNKDYVNDSIKTGGRQIYPPPRGNLVDY